MIKYLSFVGGGKTLKALLFAACAVLLVSCDNFLSGLDAKNELEDGISYANARSIGVLVNAAEGTGTTVPSGHYTAKSGYPFEVSFTESTDYAFAGWKAVFESDGTEATEGIHFDNPAALKTNVIISTEGIKVVPQCIRRIYIDGEPLPKYEATGVSRDRSITVTFSEPPAADSFLFTDGEIPAGATPVADEEGLIWAYKLNGLTYFKNIEITGTDEISLADHFKKPEVDGNLLTVAVDKSNPIEIDTGSSFKIIKVTISDKIKASNGITINSGKTWRYQVTNETDEKATVTLSSEVAEGSVYLAGTRDYSIGQKLTLAFTESADYQFIRWDYDSSVVHVAEPLSASTTAVIMEKSTGTQIKAVCAPRLRVLSFTPQNDVLSPTVSKNSSIVITFSQNLPSDEGMLNNISIAVGGSPVKNSFTSPRVNGNIITFSADKTNMLDVYAGQTKTVTVTVPADFYYETEEGYKVTYGGNGISFDYKIDNSTIEKAEIIFSSVQGSGTITPESGNVKHYSIGEEVAISFLVSDGWQFNGWKVTGADESVLSKIKIADENLPSTKLTILEAVTGVTVSADVSECLRVISKSPSAESNYKDSDIVLTFNKSLDSECSSMLNKIRISWDGTNLDGCYTDRILSADGKTITVKSTAVLSVPKNSEKTISVFIPSDFFYKNSNGLKIYHEEESFSFKVNHTTKEKAKITYSVINGETETAFSPAGAAGAINRNSYEEYNLGEEVDLSFDLNPGYQFYGWKITDAGGALVTDTVSYVNSSSSSLQPTLVMNKPAEGLKISAVCYKRPSISTSDVSPYSSNSAEEFAKNYPVTLNFAHAIKEGTEQYIEIKYSVSSFSQSTYFSRALSSDQKTVTFTPVKMLPVENTFETVTVTVPHDKVYYLAQDGKTKITPSDEDFSWSYRVNSSTLTKTTVRLDTTDANGSSINVNNIGLAGGTNQTVNVEESHNLVYPVAQDYKFMGWKLTCASSGYTVSPEGYVTSGTITVKNENGKTYFTLTIDDSDPTRATIKSDDAIGNGTGNYGLTIGVKDSLLPKITATGPAYSTGGIDCDTPVTVSFNKAINTSTVTLDSSGKIQIVDPANENEHYEEHFNSPVWNSNNDTVTIKPKYTIQELVSNGLGPKTLKVKFDLSSIKDSNGNSLFSSPESFTYRINDAMETVQPVWYSTATLYSDNTSSKRTLSTTAYSSWSYTASGSYTYGTCSQNHVGNSVYFTMYGYDLTSGIKALRITETYYKSNTDQNVTSSSVVSEIATKTLYSSSYNGIYKFDDTYTFKTTADGVIKLDFQLVDTAGNVNTAKTWYVIKDTYVQTANFAPYIDLHIANNNSDTVVMQMSSGKEADKFFERSSGYDLFADTLVEVYWGYTLNSLTIINPTTIDEWNKKYTFTHSADKLTYVKIVATDAVKNRQERIFAVPPNADVGKCTYSNGYITVSPNNASLYKSLADIARADNFNVGVFTVEDGKAISWDNAVDWNDANEDEKEYSFYPSYNGLENGKTYRVYMRIAFRYDDIGRIYSALSSNYAKIVVGSDGTVSSYTIINPNGTFDGSGYFKDPVSVTTTAVKGSGCYTVTVQDFRSSLSVSTTNISYSVKAVNTSTSETFVQDGFSINLPSPGTYKLFMIAKKTSGQTAESSWRYAYVNGASSYNTNYSLSLTGDLTPPDMGTTTSWMSLVFSSPYALTLFYQSDWSGSYGYPIDASSPLKNTITYYILPPSVSYCTESELAAYPKKTVTFNTSQVSWTLPHNSSAYQGLIELPYGDLDEGTYTICVVAEDVNGNKATRFFSVSNRLSNQKLNWLYNSSSYVITTNKLSCAFYYYDTMRNRWVFWRMGSNNTNSLTASTSDLVNKWVKLWGYNSGNSDGAYNDVEYVYLGSSVTCNNKNIMELQNGLQVFCDQSTFAHTLYSTKKLTETNTAADITKWENKGIETGIKISSTNFTYGSENLNGVPSGCYYTTVVHFRDGTKLMTEVKQK